MRLACFIHGYCNSDFREKLDTQNLLYVWGSTNIADISLTQNFAQKILWSTYTPQFTVVWICTMYNLEVFMTPKSLERRNIHLYHIATAPSQWGFEYADFIQCRELWRHTTSPKKGMSYLWYVTASDWLFICTESNVSKYSLVIPIIQFRNIVKEFQVFWFNINNSVQHNSFVCTQFWRCRESGLPLHWHYSQVLSVDQIDLFKN